VRFGCQACKRTNPLRLEQSGPGYDFQRQMDVGRSIWCHRTCGETVWLRTTGPGDVGHGGDTSTILPLTQCVCGAVLSLLGINRQLSPRRDQGIDRTTWLRFISSSAPHISSPSSLSAGQPSRHGTPARKRRYARNHEHTRRPVESAVPCIKSCKSCIHVPQRCPTCADAACAVA